MPILIRRSAASVVPSFDFYIGPTGSDSNDGLTPETPWAITALNSKRATYTGATVGLMDGTYNVKSLLDANTDIDEWALDVDGGMDGSPTIIQSVNPRQAIITAKDGSTYGNAASTPLLGHSGTTAHRGYVVFDGLKITGHSRLAIRIGIYAVGSRIPGVIVRNCEFTDMNGSAFGTNSGLNFEQLELNRCTGYKVQNNSFHDNVGEIAGSNDHFSALLTWECDQGLIEYNTCVNSGGLYAKEWEQWGHTIQYNHVDVSALSSDTSQALQDFCGSSVDNGVGTTIHHNVLIAGQVATLVQTLGEGGFITPSLSFYNNTCIIKPSIASRGPLFRTVAGQLSFYNNIIVDQSAGGSDHAAVAVNVDGPGVMDHNLWHATNEVRFSTYSNATDTSRDTVNSHNLFKSAMGGSNDANSISGSDPLFVASGANAAYYQLQGESPAKNAGRIGGTSGGATCDMGAWDGVVRIGCDF